MSAACGKAGAIISALAFNSLTKKIGTPAVLWSTSFPNIVSSICTDRVPTRTVFFGCCVAGAGFSFLLPEVRGRDPDIIYAEEQREAERLRAQN